MKIYILILLPLLLLISHASKSEQINLVGEPYCPYVCVGQQAGFMIDILNAVFKPHGHTINYKNYPWSRALQKVNTDPKVDGIVSIVQQSKTDLIFPSEILGLVRPCYAVENNSNWVYKGFDSLQSIQLGVIHNYGYEPELLNYIDKHKHNNDKIVVFAATDNTLIRMLKMITKGRLEATVDDLTVINYTINKYRLNNIKVSGCNGVNLPISVAFSKNNSNAKNYAELLSTGIKQLRKSGKLEIILSQYGVSDWK